MLDWPDTAMAFGAGRAGAAQDDIPDAVGAEIVAGNRLAERVIKDDKIILRSGGQVDTVQCGWRAAV